jgi:manganese-dependent inorganic pyrophosphatase
MGVEAEAVVAGEINKGTKLVLDKFEVKHPRTVDFKDVPEESVILVDHNEAGQRAEGLIKEHVIEVIDHHRFADFSSAAPIYIRVHPWGSTSSIVARMYQECNHVPERHVAGLMLSAILTDTLMFKSPTTTINDMQIADWLNEIVDIDMMAHANDIFKAKSDISDLTIGEVIHKDYKEFHFNDHITTAVAVFETVDATGPLARKDEFLAELKKIKADKKYDHMLFSVVDIVNQVANFIPTDEADAELLKHVFGVEVKDGLVVLPGIVSRKKQVIPPLEEHFAGLDH